MNELDESLRYLESAEAGRSLEADPYWPKWDSPWWRMLLLHEMGRTRDIPAAAVEKLVHSLSIHLLPVLPLRPSDVPEAKDKTRNFPCHCQLGTVYQVLARCGVDVDRALPWIRPWFLRYQLPDGGLNCDESAYTKPVPRSSVVSTLPALEAILLCTPRSFTPKETAYLERGAQYLADRKLWRSVSRGGTVMDESWAKLCFPRFYHYDLLRGLAFLVRDAKRCVRPLPLDSMMEAFEIVREQVEANGSLAPGRRAFEGTKSLRRKDDGTWEKGDSSSFPLLDTLSAVGVASESLTREWREVRDAVETVRARRPLPIRTPRLELVPMTLDTAAAAEAGGDALTWALRVRVPESWPPRVEDDPHGAGTVAGFRFVREKLLADPKLLGWWGWFVVRSEGEDRTLVGIVSPKGPPNDAGVVEVGYSTVREHEGRGYATEATGALLEWIRRDPRVQGVVAETLPHLGASLAVMRKLGMVPLGEGSEPGVVRYGIRVRQKSS